jgi:predicted DNA-binding transcriptional regulator AlpA
MTTQPATPAAIEALLAASITERELCKRWNITTNSVYDFRKDGRMPPHFQWGVIVRYLLSDIELAERTTHSVLMRKMPPRSDSVKAAKAAAKA